MSDSPQNSSAAPVALPRGTVIACPACGYQNGGWETRCQKCGRRFNAPRAAAPAQAPAGIRAAAAKAKPAPAFPEHLRKELRERVDVYRSRRERSLSLPFDGEPGGAQAEKVVAFPALPAEERPGRHTVRADQARAMARARAAAALKQGARKEPFPAEPSRPQVDLEFPPVILRDERWQLPPVAPLESRMKAHACDLLCILGLSALFLVPAAFVRGGMELSLPVLAGVAVGIALLALGFGVLFLVWIGVTPGMKAAGLRLVHFKGTPTSRSERLLRLAGCLVSAGSFLIGFLWAVADEERLYWHDHISKTFLTVSERSD